MYYFLRYLEWTKGNGYWRSAEEMLQEYRKLKPEERFRHVDTLERYLKGLESGFRDKGNRWFAQE